MRWKGGRAWGQSGMMLLESEVHGPSGCTSALPRLYVFASGTWIAFCCGSLCWEGHKDEPATVPYSWPEVQKKGWRWGHSWTERPASFKACRSQHLSADTGQKQGWVAFSFAFHVLLKLLLKGWSHPRFFHFRGSACEKGGGGELWEGLPLVQQSCRSCPLQTDQPGTCLPGSDRPDITVYGSQERGPKSLSSVPVSKVLGPWTGSHFHGVPWPSQMNRKEMNRAD